MNKFTEEIVDDLAAKLLIGLTREENKMVLDEMEEINNTLNIINEIEELKNIEPMTHCLDDFEFTLRDDIATESIEVRDLLSNCDDYEGREVQVPKVVG